MTPGVTLSVVVPAHDEAANLARLVDEVRTALDGAALACGVRAARRDPPTRRLASALANAARRLFLAPRLRAMACPLRVFRAYALRRVGARGPLFEGAHRWLPALFHLAGARVVQRPVSP